MWSARDWRAFKAKRMTMNVCSAFGEGKIIKHNLEIKKDADPKVKLAVVWPPPAAGESGSVHDKLPHRD